MLYKNEHEGTSYFWRQYQVNENYTKFASLQYYSNDIISIFKLKWYVFVFMSTGYCNKCNNKNKIIIIIIYFYVYLYRMIEAFDAMVLCIADKVYDICQKKYNDEIHYMDMAFRTIEHAM